jgi:hypothetical protein
MLESHLQSIRYKLQRRLRSLQRAETDDFNFAIRRFFTAIDSLEPIKDIMVVLEAQHTALTEQELIRTQLKDAWGPELQIPTEEEYAAFSYALLKFVASAQDAGVPSSIAM